MLKAIAAIVAFAPAFIFAGSAFADDHGSIEGLIVKESAHSVDETVRRLKAALKKRDVKVMSTVDHARNAAGADLDLPPTTLVIFGNPAAGTQLMQASRSAAIDLPMKALIAEENGAVTLSYNDVAYIAKRHGVSSDLPVLAKIAGLLDAVSTEATSADDR